MKQAVFILALICLALCSFNLRAYYYGENKVNATYTSWSQIETMHFDIYFARGNDNFGRLAALMAEDTYYYLKKDFVFPAMSRIPIIFYASQQEFQTTNIIYPLLSEGIGGFTESLKNRVVIPFTGSYAELERVLTHELTHAYINALDSGSPGSFFYLRNFYFPDWFSEGLPEFEAVGGTNINNNNYVMDAVINDRFRTLNDTYGYSNYRMGEAFLVFLQTRYGRVKVMDFLYSLRAVNDLDKSSRKIFGMNFKDLESRWKNQLKRDYFPFIQNHTAPNESSERKTDHEKDGSYLNMEPRFAPDGQKYIYFSNRDGRFSIWTGGLFEHPPARKLITGESTGKMEEFHYLRTGLAWFPDSNLFAYVAKTSFGDRVYIADYDKGEIIKKLDIPGINIIYEIDLSPDGESLVFSGQSQMRSDLFLYRFDNHSLMRLTDDLYNDYQPRFAPDGLSIAFTSERTKGTDTFRKGYFSGLRSNLYTIRIDDNTLTQVTFEDYNCYHPVWDSSGTKIIFISEQDSIPNLHIVDVLSGQRAGVTNVMSGIYGFDLNPNDRYLIYSCFYNGAWDIYLKTEPLHALQYVEYPQPQVIAAYDSMLAGINLERLDYFGKRPRHKSVTDGGPVYSSQHPTVINFKPGSDSLWTKRDYSWDNRPDSITVIPTVRPYRIKFKLDNFFGGFAYASSIGAVGTLELSMSDILGNHAVGISLGLAGKLKDSSLILTYLYLPRRLDYGIGVFILPDEIDYFYYQGTDIVYLRNRTRQTGLYSLIRCPINKFLRFDIENQLYSWENHWDISADGTHYQNDYIEAEKDFVYAPAITLVHDNALYGPTGPLLGWRTYLTLIKSFALHDKAYQTAFLDFRSYTLFSKRYALALRLVGGYSGGKQPQTFALNTYYGVRGYESSVEGEKTALASAELRFPFLDYLALAFPLPITLSSIRGSAFADLGSVWNNTSEFRGMQNGILQDLHLGFGFGPRINVGFAVLKFDIAWLTDLSNVSRPTYYFSLTEDF